MYSKNSPSFILTGFYVLEKKKIREAERMVLSATLELKEGPYLLYIALVHYNINIMMPLTAEITE